MANKKDSTIFYQDQIEICRRHFNAEQFGRLMLALFEIEEGNEPEVDEDIAIAFEFMALQKRIDRKKYEEICKKNRENGKKGGRPKKNKDENPTEPNGFFKNPNDNDNDKRMIRKDNDNDNEATHDSVLTLGTFNNVELTGKEYAALKQQYERTTELINKVSVWIRGADGEVRDHYALCIKFATNDKWPERKVIEPVELYEPEDPLSEEEQREKVADMRARLNGAFEAG